MQTNWRQTQKEALQRELYETALRLFRENGYEATSTRQITETVGVAKGTFFNYYPSKEAVLAQFMDEVTAEGLAATRAQPDSAAEEMVINLMVNLGRAAQADFQLFCICCELAGSNSFIQHKDRELDAALDWFMRTAITSGQSQDELVGDANVDDLLAVLIATLTHTAREWNLVGDAMGFEATIIRRVRLVFRAVKVKEVLA